jgi:uncharacterized caspase-like protein
MRRALLIGVNYVRNERNRLYGCVNDVRNMQQALAQAKPGVEFRVLHDEGATWPSRANVLEGFAWLLDGLAPGDAVLVHYSGHGGLTVDRSGDEATGYDSCIFPVSESGAVECITDDEIRALLAERVPARCKLTAVFDCCHSGTCLDLRYTLGGRDAAVVLTENRRYRRTDATVLFLSACADAQTAAEAVADSGAPTGALTTALLAALPAGAKLNRVLCAIRAQLKAAGYEQAPQVSCGRAVPFDTPLL